MSKTLTYHLTFAVLGLLFFLPYTRSWSQNLVLNPSFEDYTYCPGDFSQFCDNIPNWLCATMGTVDYYNACSSTNMGVPYNELGIQDARTGVAYAGILMRLWYSNWREYPMISLSQPLQAGTWYTLEYYVSLADFSCGVEHFGVYFSVNNPYSAITTPYPAQPQLETDYGFFSDTAGWQLIRGCYQAQGGEQYIFFGNFHDDLHTPLDPHCAAINQAYYYIDDVSLVEGISTDEPELLLGGPEFACYTYEIVPETDAIYYSWSDGSHEPTLTVTQSGTYALTVSDGCHEVIDSIEVTVAGVNPPVDLGPPEVMICSGESYDIALDPDLEVYTWSDGSDGPDFSIDTEGSYAVTFDDGCAVTTDAIYVHVVDPPPPIDLGDDGPLCDGYEIEYNFDPSVGEYAWLDGSTNASYTISGGGTYGLTVTNMCGIESDEITITDLEAPFIDLGNQVVSICSGQTYSLELDPALGDFTWQDGSTASDYYITQSGHYSVTVTNICGSGSDYVDVMLTQTPQVDLGPDLHLCPGDTIELNGGSTAGTYVWQDQSSASTFEVTQSGTYSLTVANSCGTDADTVSLLYATQIGPPDLGPDILLCPGETAILTATTPGASYSWSDGSSADTLSVTNAGTYFVRVYTSCQSYTDTIVVSTNSNPPQVDLPAMLTLCQGQMLTLDAVVPGVNYLWSDLSQSQTLSVQTPGIYSVTVSNTCGADADTVIVTDGGPMPMVDLGGDPSLCPGDTLVIQPTFSFVNSWLWQDGSTGDTFSITGPGTYSVAVSNACGSASDSVVVIPLPAIPTLNLGPDTALCPGESLVLSISASGVSIDWMDGSTMSTYTVAGPGEVFAMISNSCGTTADTIEVSENPEIPTLDLGADQSLCPGESILIAPGIQDVAYMWHDGSTGNSYTSVQQELVILTISNACGMATDTLHVVESTDGPHIDLGPDIHVCTGDSVHITSGISGVQYVWQDGSTGPDYLAVASGTIVLQVSNSCGMDTDTIMVDISGTAPLIDLGVDTTLCEGTSLMLAVSVPAGTHVQWTDGTMGDAFLVTAPGLYGVSASNTCGSALDTIQVAYLPVPEPFTLGHDTILCPGEQLLLIVPETGFAIQWHDGSDQETYVVNHPESVSLQLSNTCGTVSDALQVDYDQNIPVLNLDPEFEWCPGDIIILNATQSFPAEYLWSTGSTQPVLSILSPGVYSVEVTTPCHQLLQAVEVVADSNCETFAESHEIYIPNVFSPNGDNINDVFAPAYGNATDLKGITGYIFDRWGNQVYQSNDSSFAWDGRFHQEELPPGVYAYLLYCRILVDGQEQTLTFSGDVTLIR